MKEHAQWSITPAVVAAVLAAPGVLVGVTQLAGREATKPAATAVPQLGAGPLAAPTGDVVLRLEGVAHGNAGAGTTELDFKTLDGLARQSLTVREPFLTRDMTFTGVNLGQLLDRAGVAASTRRIFLHALADHHVELPFAELKKEALLATRANGRPIAIADGGPIRVVFPNGSELGAVTDNWIWSVDRLAAR